LFLTAEFFACSINSFSLCVKFTEVIEIGLYDFVHRVFRLLKPVWIDLCGKAGLARLRWDRNVYVWLKRPVYETINDSIQLDEKCQGWSDANSILVSYFGSANLEDIFINFLNSVIELGGVRKTKDSSLPIRTVLLRYKG
jgi:hypothetical protein